MRVMEYIREHREDENPFECVILPDGSVDAPVPSHIEKLAQIAGEDKISLNKKMEKNMEPLFFMVEYTGCMLVWETRVVEPSHPTKEQKENAWSFFMMQRCFLQDLRRSRQDRSMRPVSDG